MHRSRRVARRRRADHVRLRRRLHRRVPRDPAARRRDDRRDRRHRGRPRYRPAPPPSSARRGAPGTFGDEASGGPCADRLALPRSSRAAHVPRPLPLRGARRRLRRRRRREPAGLGRRVGVAARRDSPRDAHRARRVIRRAWGHPVYVRGDVSIDGEQRRPARDRHPAEPVRRAARAGPALAFTSTAGMQRRAAATASRGSSPRRHAARRGRARPREDRRRGRQPSAHARSCSRCSGSCRRWRSSRRLLVLRPGAEDGYDREYEQEPPSELEPALVPSLVAQRTRVGSNEFTATLFDLIRRGRYKAEGVTTERRTGAASAPSRSPTSSSRAERTRS